jgi:SPP1 family predicted phage head-tail adaptor
VKAGNLDRRIELQRRSVAAADANGSSAVTYATYAEVWAEKVDAGGREFYAGNQTQAELATQFRIRYRADLQPTDRVRYDGKSFNISHTKELGRRQELILFATATVS